MNQKDIPLNLDDYYKKLAEKHAETDWSNLEEIRAYNEYARLLRSQMEFSQKQYQGVCEFK